jgi:hypothetical protein
MESLASALRAPRAVAAGNPAEGDSDKTRSSPRPGSG